MESGCHNFEQPFHKQSRQGSSEIYKGMDNREEALCSFFSGYGKPGEELPRFPGFDLL